MLDEPIQPQSNIQIKKIPAKKPRPPIQPPKSEQDNLKKILRRGTASLFDLIAPAAFVLKSNHLQLNNLYCRTLFVYGYPRFLQSNWLYPLINYDITVDISMHIYPLESRSVMGQLRKKVGQLESTMIIEQEKGMVRNPELETAIGDIENLRDVLQRGEIRIFQYGLYFTIYAQSMEELETITKQIESTLGGMLIYTKPALLQMEQGFNSTTPLATDQLQVMRNLDTGSLSTTFPFTSAELTSNSGILYGLNRHNNSLILFDRFDLENANSVVFAKAGAGKSYAIKLEALRSLMFDTDIIVIDPENEYKTMCETIGGVQFNVSLNSDQWINPFDLPKNLPDDTSGDDVLRAAVVSVHGLLRLMLGNITPDEDAILEKAVFETYALKDISGDLSSQQNPPPLLTDLESVLNNMSGAESLIKRLGKYTQGIFSELFTKPTNIDLKKGFVVFSIRDLEEQLRPIGMYMILNYIWSIIRYDMRKRILIIDESWLMMQYEDSARFLYSIAKRARKYYLGLTIITQDVEDFLDSKYGRSVINNSSMQLLLRQSPAAIDKVADVFNLTEGEKFLLLESNVGEGLFFAGSNHVAIKVIASPTEDQMVTTNPEELLARGQ